jgi:hypothetical protein
MYNNSRYYSVDEIKVDEMDGSCSTYGKMRNAYNILVGKGSPGRPRRRWEDNFRMDIREIRWEGVDWMHLIQDRDQWRPLMNTVMSLRVL